MSDDQADCVSSCAGSAGGVRRPGFDDLFTHIAQRRGFREYLAGLAGAEPVTGSKLPTVQRLQFFLSESVWDPEAVNDRRLALPRAGPMTAPHEGGVLVIDDSGDRKDGTATAHVGRQYLGGYGKTDNGIVTVTTVWADERVYYPLRAVPYTRRSTSRRGRTTRSSGPSCRYRRGTGGPGGGSDCAYGDQDGFRAKLAQAGLPFVTVLRPRHGI